METSYRNVSETVVMSTVFTQFFGHTNFLSYLTLKGNATLKQIELQSKELHKPWILVQISSKSVKK